MRLLCALGRHQPSPTTVLNQDRRFSRCSACGTDLVEAEGGWKTAPKGFRIVWKRVETPVAAESEEAGLRRRRRERRAGNGGEVPAHLIGRERRKGRDRRHGFGKRPDEE